MIKLKKAILESRFAGDEEKHKAYARAACRDCLDKGYSAIASHLLWTQEGITDDHIPEERALGIEAGLVWGEAAEITFVYVDLGVSVGMKQGIARAINEGRPVVYLNLPNFKQWEEQFNIKHGRTIDFSEKKIALVPDFEFTTTTSKPNLVINEVEEENEYPVISIFDIWNCE